VVPKKLWGRLNPPDENNMCTWAMRCLLIEMEDHLVLIDTGIGDKQDDKFRSHFEPHGDETLISSIEQAGFSASDVTDVILTHMHFDHCGAAVSKSDSGELKPTFPKAKYWTNKAHWKAACNPNPREKASFLEENFLPLEEADVLHFATDLEEIVPGIIPHFVYGHTEAMMVLEIQGMKRPLFYSADLVPSKWHIGLPWVMAYDIRPLLTMPERERWLKQAHESNGLLFFEHDPESECGSLIETERGMKLGETFRLKDVV